MTSRFAPTSDTSAKAEVPLYESHKMPIRESPTNQMCACPRANAGTTRMGDCGSHNSAFSRHTAPEFCKFVRPKNREGAGKTGCALHPRSRVQRVDKKAHTSIQVQRKQSGLPCAVVLQLISCSPRRDQSLFVTVAPEKRELLANLTPAIGASGPHDFAVRFTRRSSKAHPRPPLPAPTSVTMANAPSLGTGWQGISR
jgi:hypothetical protein